MNESAFEERGGDPVDRPHARIPAGGAAVRASGGASALHLYKPGQGQYVRWGTAIGIGIIALGIANGAYEWLADQILWIQVLAPVAIMVVMAYVAFWLLGQYKPVVDFMIATEGEMRKVNWSSWREVWGSTKVVIVSVLALGFLLCLVDLLFIFWFEAIGVLRIGILDQFFKTQ